MKKLLTTAAIAALVSGAAQAADTFVVPVQGPVIEASRVGSPPMLTIDDFAAGTLIDTTGFVSARFQVNGISCFELGDEITCGQDGIQKVTVQVSPDGGTTWEPLGGGAGVWKSLPAADRLSSPIPASGNLVLPASQKVPGLRFRLAYKDTATSTPPMAAAIVQFKR